MKKSRLIIFIIVLLVIATVSIRFVKNVKTTNSSEEEVQELTKIETSYNEEILYRKLQKGLVQYWNGSLYFYDVQGNEKWHNYLGITNPLIKTNKNNIYVIDNNLKQLIRIDEKGQIQYRYTMEMPLNNFEISDDNYVIIQYPKENNMVNLQIIDDEGRKYSKIVLTEGDVINLSLSKSHDIIAINTLITQNSLESRLLLYDLNGQLIGSNHIEEQLVLGFEYDKKGNLIVIAEDEVFSINRNNEILWRTSVNRIKNFSNYPDEYMVIYGHRSSKNPFIHTEGNEDLNILKYNGKITAKAQVGEEILGLDVDRDGILLYSTRSIYLLDINGKIIMTNKYLHDIKDVFIFPKGHLVVASKEDLSFLKIN